MPDLDGFQVLRMIREIGSTPVIMLTAKGEENDKVRGLELGADDYVTKPFSPRELTSRIRAVLRRGSFSDQTDTGKIDVDGRRRRIGSAAADGIPLTLPLGEKCWLGTHPRPDSQQGLGL